MEIIQGIDAYYVVNSKSEGFIGEPFSLANLKSAILYPKKIKEGAYVDAAREFDWQRVPSGDRQDPYYHLHLPSGYGALALVYSCHVPDHSMVDFPDDSEIFRDPHRCATIVNTFFKERSVGRTFGPLQTYPPLDRLVKILYGRPPVEVEIIKDENIYNVALSPRGELDVKPVGKVTDVPTEPVKMFSPSTAATHRRGQLVAAS